MKKNKQSDQYLGNTYDYMVFTTRNAINDDMVRKGVSPNRILNTDDIILPKVLKSSGRVVKSMYIQ